LIAFGCPGAMSEISLQSGAGAPMLPAAAGAGSDVEQGVPIAEEEPQPSRPKHFSDKPERFFKHLWPTGYGWLETAGYDHALVIQDRTHASIYISAVISFFFSAMWLTDVFTLGCFSESGPNDEDIGGDSIVNSVSRCLFELIGGLIFFGGLRDSIIMLGNYDSDHMLLMNRKNELMDELQTDITQALGKAKKNADQLYGLLFKLYEQKVQTYIENIFEVILPILCGELLENHHSSQSPVKQQERDHDCVKVQSLVKYLEGSLAEPAHLSAGLCRTMPDLYSKFNVVCPNIQETANALDDTDTPLFWLVKMEDSDLSSYFDAPFAPAGSLASDMSAGHVRSGGLDMSAGSARSPHGQGHVRSVADVPMSERENMKANPQAYVFASVKKIVVMLEDLLNGSKGGMAPDGLQESYDQLMGVGAPPWSSGEQAQTSLFLCCCPRLIAFCMFRCCCFCCCCSSSSCTMYGNAMKYPKYGRFGFIWFQIVSKLHERLIQGLVLCCLFFAYYFQRVFLILFTGCPKDATSSLWWACFLQELKRCGLLLALFVHVAASLRCLVRIRDLDAVIKIMEDIRKLQGLRGIIQDFGRTLVVDEDRQVLLDAVKVRLLNRINIVDQFRRRIYDIKHQHKSNHPRMKLNLREATTELIKYFAFSAAVLKPASEWLDMKKEDQEKRCQQIDQYEHALTDRDFRPDLSGASSIIPSDDSTSSLPSSTSTASPDPEGASRKLTRKLTPPMRAKKTPRGESGT